MPVLKNVLGLDLGSHGIKAVELQQTFRGAAAAQMRSLPRVGDEVPLPELIRRFVQLHDLSTAHVVSALRADRISSRRLAFPFADRRRLDQAVAFEVEGDEFHRRPPQARSAAAQQRRRALHAARRDRS